MTYNQHPTPAAALGFEQTLWAAADKLRGHLDAADYKHVVLGLIFLKYISDAFTDLYHKLEADEWSDPEDRDEYLAENVFWVPAEARWSRLQAGAKTPEIGLLLDRAMAAIEQDNPRLKGVLPQNYGRETLDKRRLGELVDLIGTIGLGDKTSQAKDILGRVYEYFLGQFAAAEGKKGGEFYTAQAVVRVLVALLEPYQGRVYDPCCGSGGMFVQSERFVEAHGGRLDDLSVYGQESNPTTWRLCQMNLALRGIEGNLGRFAADTFHNDLHPDLRADFILANPPFNMSDWGGQLLGDDPRWRYGTPPAGNANFAWMQHMIAHLSHTGRAGIVLANGSMSVGGVEGEIRRAIIEADLVDCMVALPGQLFYTTQIPVCLWILNRAKPDQRRGQTLFIDARSLGSLVNRTLRQLSEEEIERIAAAYHAWRTPAAAYADRPGFCQTASREEIAGHGYVLTPGRYVGAAEVEEDGEPFEEKMERLAATLQVQFADSARLEQVIKQNLDRLNLGQD